MVAQTGLNPKVSKTVGHISLDFSVQDKDKLTNTKMMQIAKRVQDKNDRYRSEEICKEMTGKHGLYFIHGKENVKVHRLKEPDKTKYEIYGVLKVAVSKFRN